jgi:hypothetical protein
MRPPGRRDEKVCPRLGSFHITQSNPKANWPVGPGKFAAGIVFWKFVAQIRIRLILTVASLSFGVQYQTLEDYFQVWAKAANLGSVGVGKLLQNFRTALS